MLLRHLRPAPVCFLLHIVERAGDQGMVRDPPPIELRLGARTPCCLRDGGGGHDRRKYQPRSPKTQRSRNLECILLLSASTWNTTSSELRATRASARSR